MGQVDWLLHQLNINDWSVRLTVMCLPCHFFFVSIVYLDHSLSHNDDTMKKRFPRKFVTVFLEF